MEDIKFCPFVQLPSGAQSLCMSDRCALYTHGRCALVDIADSLVEIAMDTAALDQGGI